MNSFVRSTLAAVAIACAMLAMTTGAAAMESADANMEEVVVVGTQIRGAQISEALPVSVISDLDIEALGVNSGDELLEFMAEQGNNFFSEAENISGGVNSARGDIGAFNLRNLGTGNTLVLLNGRRMVNTAAYQTEEVGGSFVPVNTVNAQSLPVTGLRRLEVLRDGASAIYGADAVAGVVNYVLKNDFEGLRLRVRGDTYAGLPRTDLRFTAEWGASFNDGRTTVGAFLNHYNRDRVNSQDDPRWAVSDFRDRAPSPFDESTVFRNNSINNGFGQYDIRPSVGSLNIPDDVVDSAGEFVTYPVGHENCVFDINETTCGADDTAGNLRYNLNADRDLFADLSRTNLYAYVEHDFNGTLSGFAEATWYSSDTNTIRHPSAPLSAVAKHRIAADAYYNPFGPCESPNRLPDSVIGTDVPCEGLELELDNYRFTQVPRVADVDGDTWRIVAGLRGTFAQWDWEGALLWSRAERTDVTHNRISNNLIADALNDTTTAGFNPFSPTREGSNIDRALIDVVRDNEQELRMLDFKISNANIFELPAGTVGVLAGIEFRDESFTDDRDPRLDGTITYTDHRDNTFPFISDVVNSSPTSDSSGDRQVVSLFGELQVPVLDNLDVQLAVRHENFSDVGNTTVGKAAFGYRPIEMVLLRGSWSQAFRAPNLITINEATVSRSNTRNDIACLFVDPEEETLDCSYGIQRTVQGNPNIGPETSDNYSFGFVVEPTDSLTITFDTWSIVKDDTIGLFGEENHIALDLFMRQQAGNANCDTAQGNPAVIRDSGELEEDVAALYTAAGLCPLGEVQRVDDQYANLDTRTVRGHDLGIYFDMDTAFGNWDFRYVGTFLSEYEQEASGQAALLAEAQANGNLPDAVPIVGFADLRGINGRPIRKDTVRVNWGLGDWQVAATALRIHQFNQMLSGGDLFPVDSMTTYNMNVTYNFRIMEMDSRVRLGINNVTDTRAPLADRFFGYFADQHTDLGRFFYLDYQIKVL